jgi:hypothetical protein
MGRATPLLTSEGWTRHQEEVAKRREASFNGRVVGNGTSSQERILKKFVNPDHY